MKILFPKKKYHIPKWFIIDATNKTIGFLSTLINELLCGKKNTFFTKNINQGNYILLINIKKIKITLKKEKEKLYYKNSNRPGSLKKETFKNLSNRIPERVFEHSIWGMLSKTIIGREYYKRLFILNN